MTFPFSAATVPAALDPHEILDFTFDAKPLLEAGEAIAAGTWTIEVLPEGVAMGLVIMTGGGRDPALAEANTQIDFWLEIHNDFKTDPEFEAGIDLPFEVTVPTNASPNRVRQRTCVVRVVQQ
jgi:hypothetical protein